MDWDLQKYFKCLKQKFQKKTKIKIANPNYTKESKICWNCSSYCTFSSICFEEGIQKDYKETCELFKKDK